MTLSSIFKIMGEAGFVSTLFGLLAFFGTLYASYLRLLPQPLPEIPYDTKSARKLLGDIPDLAREVGVTRELNVWLVRQVNKFQGPLCQVFVQPFSKPWILLADAVEAQDVMMRRPEFDRSELITDGLSAMDGSHLRMKTGQTWKTARGWLQDLMKPSFLNDIVGPALYENSTYLVDFWETKARLANDRPFDVNEDLNHSALDGMLSFMFDRHFEHTALGPQIHAVSQLDPSRGEVGPSGEARFPASPLHEFIVALYKTVDAIEKVTKSISPRLAMWWIRQTPGYSKVTAVKRRVVKEQVQGAHRRLQATDETKTAIEHMLMRERKAAEKQGRKPDLKNPIMVDEVR